MAVGAHHDLAVELKSYTTWTGVLLVAGVQVSEYHSVFAELGVQGADGVVPHQGDVVTRGRTLRRTNHQGLFCTQLDSPLELIVDMIA